MKKKFGDSDIGTLSRDLVAKWKASVQEEEDRQEYEETQEGAENVNDDPDPSPEYSVPEYVPSRIPVEETRKASSGEENDRERGDSSQDEEQSSRKSKRRNHTERRDLRSGPSL